MTKRKSPQELQAVKPHTCDVCGRPLRYGNTSGVCSGAGSSAACKHERRNRDRIAQGLLPYKTSRPAGELITVRAGEVYNSWTVLEDGAGVVNKVPCRCKCGTERSVAIATLTGGVSKSCGRRCDAKRIADPYLPAGVYGHLTVLETALRAKDMVRVRCDCDGTETTKRAGLIKNGHTRSCGCRAGRFTHGLSRHPLYSVWNGMVDRCTNPTASGYEGYGGRPIGPIKVCDRWLDVALFIEDIMGSIGPRPEGSISGRPLYELDRIDNDGNYEPGNVRWADKLTQAGNRRTIKSLTKKLSVALTEIDRLTGASVPRPAPRKRTKVAVVAPGQDALF